MVGPITYVFEQCAKILPIKPKLCSVGSHYVHMVNITTNLIHSCCHAWLNFWQKNACMHAYMVYTKNGPSHMHAKVVSLD